MNINKLVNYTLQFENETCCDYFLANALLNYINEKNSRLADYIGFSNDNNPNGINDFLYACSSKEKKILKEIEGYIDDFIKTFNLISDILESQCEIEEINNDAEFYEQFKKLSEIIQSKKDLDSSLIKKDGKKTKVKL